MEITPPHLFIAGVPCTGKSLLGSWLEKEHGYIHIDAEGGVDFDRAGVHREWDEFLMMSGRAKNFVAAVNRRCKPMVLNWGLPMEDLFVVAALQAERVESWWFRGELGQARRAFIEREEKKPEAKRIPVERFDRQMDQIDRHWLLIERLFGERMVDGLQADGSQRKPEDLWAGITATNTALDRG